VRTCVGCRRRTAKAELVRVVATDSGAGLVLVPDPRGRAPGRGAHLHPTRDCLELALRRRAFTRALRAPGGLGLDSGQLEEYVKQVEDRA
jgi:predicted RNA-binding protein YlxR (DUF448 family)